MKSLPKRFIKWSSTIFLLVTLSPLLAQFQVSPMLIEHYLENNESAITTIDVRNNKNTPLQLSIYLKDKAFIDGVESEVLPGTFERSASDWIFFTPSILNLAPKEFRTIRLNINIPDSAKGTYWSNLYIEETSAPEAKTYERKNKEGDVVAFQLNINMRVGILITQTVPGTSIRSGLIETIDFRYDNEKNSGFIDFQFLNDGNSISECIGWVEFRDIDGLTVKKRDLDYIPNIYPLEKRNFTIEVPKDLISGEYSALAIIDYGGSQLVAGEIIFEYLNPEDEE